MDSCGHRWRWKPAVPARMDTNGRPWTPLGDLRIRRLGVRVPPGVPREAPVQAGFRRVGGGGYRPDLMPSERSSGAILCQSDGIAGEAEPLLKAFA